MRFRIILIIVFTLGLFSCSLTKYVPQNESLLKSIKFKDNNTKVSNTELHSYVLQKPNSYILGVIPFKLGMYSMSGRDTTKFFNRFLQRIGEPPVILDTNLIYDTQLSLQQALKNRGYLDAQAASHYITKRKKTKLFYTLQSGSLYKIRYFSFDIENDSAISILNQNYTINSLTGQDFDVDRLNELRENITHIFRQQGYYNVQKEIFSFVADTVHLTDNVDLKLVIQKQYRDSDIVEKIFTKKRIDNITIYCFEDLDQSELSPDTLHFNDYIVIYNSKRRIFRPTFLANKVFLKKNQLYNEVVANRTTANFNSIAAVKYVNVGFTEKESDMLDCNIYIYILPKNTAIRWAWRATPIRVQQLVRLQVWGLSIEIFSIMPKHSGSILV